MSISKWRMPAEWFSHKCCWMLVPYRLDNWRQNAIPAQHAFLNVAQSIARFEKVYLGVHPSIKESFTALFIARQKLVSGGHGIELFDADYNDCWMRDVGATFLHKDSSATASAATSTDPSIAQVQEQLTASKASLIAMDWIFNAWGEKYSCWVQDDLIASAMVAHPCNTGPASSIQRIRADFVLEGGSIHVDGEGTVLVTEECLLHTNRNPALTKAQIEERLRVYLGVQSVIWLPRGLTADHDTNGHIDNIACFARPGVVLLSWTDDDTDEMYAICREAEAVLSAAVDACGRALEVVRLPLPQPMYYTAEECAGDNSGTDSASAEDKNAPDEGAEDCAVTGYLRDPGARMAGSYVNFYIANGGIIVPSFGQAAEDARAVQVLQGVFGSSYEVASVPQCREILLGGGNIHCITQQQPLPK